MTKRRWRALFLILLLCLTAGRYVLLKRTVQNGVRILIPAAAQIERQTADFCLTDVRYFNIIPPAYIDGLSGTAVLRRADSGLAAFERPYDAKTPLRPKEILLQWRVARPADDSSARQNRVRVDFAKTSLPACAADKKLRRTQIKYAVLKVGKSGRAALTALADKNGEEVLTLGRQTGNKSP